jgi:hypothetical protein
VATVVLVHGIAQEQLSAESLEKDWIPALAGGVHKAGFSAIADRIWRDRSGPLGIETRMAFYGHLFLRPDRQGGDGMGDFTLEQASQMEELAQVWLERAAVRSSNQDDRQVAGAELAYVRHEIGAEEAGLRELPRKAINALVKLPWFAPFGMAFAERFVIKALGQVTRYLTDEHIRTEALKAVLDLTGRDTKVIIGHSLGSVVAYEAVHLMDPPLPLLVTIGSPLGLETIVYSKLRPQPPAYPPRLLRWVNIADPNDLVAAEPDLGRFFSLNIPPAARFEAAHTVDNGAEPHSSDFYLTKAQLGKPVGETLSAALTPV